MKKTLFDIPNSDVPFLLFISGTSGIGKSTFAHRILQHWEEPIILEEVDLLREAIRGYSSNLTMQIKSYIKNVKNVNLDSINEIVMTQVIENPILYKSTFLLSVEEFSQQCEILVPAIYSICKRLEKKGIPAILEGTNLDPVAILASHIAYDYFGMRKNLIFLNLHISDKEQHIRQLTQRNKEQESTVVPNYEKIVHRSLELYNRLSKFQLSYPQYSNIYNLDLSNKVEYEDSNDPFLSIIKSCL